MDEKDKKGFLVLMAMLSEAFKEEMSSERGKIYFEFLRKYPLYQVVWSVNQSIKELKYFPKVSELIDFINPSTYEDLTDPQLLLEGNKGGNKKALEYIAQMAKTIGEKKDVNRILKLQYKK